MGIDKDNFAFQYCNGQDWVVCPAPQNLYLGDVRTVYNKKWFTKDWKLSDFKKVDQQSLKKDMTNSQDYIYVKLQTIQTRGCAVQSLE